MDIKIISVEKSENDFYNVFYSYGKERWYEDDFSVKIIRANLVDEVILEVVLSNLTKSRFQPLFKRLAVKSRSIAVNIPYNEEPLTLTGAGIEMRIYF